MTDLLVTGPDCPRATLLLAHGAGAPMDSSFMTAIAESLADAGIGVVRFEFAYMAGRRRGDGRRPPPRAERLTGEFAAAIDRLDAAAPLLIGGKSLGARVASLIAQQQYDTGRIAGLVCLGYPFHPPSDPHKLRTVHLRDLTVPTLICQGERDPFGNRSEIDTYGLAPAIALHWLVDGDHDLKPRKASGVTFRTNLQAAAAAVAAFAASLAPG